MNAVHDPDRRVDPAAEDGQGAAGYTGAAAVIAIIVVAVVTSGLGEFIANALVEIVRQAGALGG